MTSRRRVAGMVVLVVACTPQPPATAPLDPPARAACELLGPVAGDVRTGRLEGPPLFRLLQDVFNEAGRSANTEVRESAEAALSGAINDDRPALRAALTRMQVACGLPPE